MLAGAWDVPGPPAGTGLRREDQRVLPDPLVLLPQPPHSEAHPATGGQREPPPDGARVREPDRVRRPVRRREGERHPVAHGVEVLRDGVNGRLVDFFDVPGWSKAIIRALADPQADVALRAAARATVLDRYDLQRRCLPKLVDFVEAAVDRA